MNLPMKLVEYRQTNKLSQEDLAAKLGVSRQSVSKWEQGISFPETDKLIELSNMMGVSIDSLLKGESEPSSPAPESDTTPRRNLILAVLLAVICTTAACVALGFFLRFNAVNPLPTTEPASETTLPTQTTATEAPTTPTETEQEDITLDSGLENKDLKELRQWFFDFARRWRLDYMPQFTTEDGPPTDAGEYLYWCYAINADTWTGNTMTKDYVEETILSYFCVEAGQHRSRHKQWNYDGDKELYTAYPGSLKEQHYYQLNSIEVHGNATFTVQGTCYYTTTYGFTEELETVIQNTLFEGSVITETTTIRSGEDSANLVPIAQFSLTFNLDHVFSQPRFKALEVTMLTDLVRW